MNEEIPCRCTDKKEFLGTFWERINITRDADPDCQICYGTGFKKVSEKIKDFQEF